MIIKNSCKISFDHKHTKLSGKKYICVGLIRSTYIIDENGIIEHVLWKVNPETNAQDVLDLL